MPRDDDSDLSMSDASSEEDTDADLSSSSSGSDSSADEESEDERESGDANQDFAIPTSFRPAKLAASIDGSFLEDRNCELWLIKVPASFNATLLHGVSLALSPAPPPKVAAEAATASAVPLTGSGSAPPPFSVVESDSSECGRILNVFPVSENAADKTTLRVGKPFARMLHVVDPLAFNQEECVAAAQKARKIKLPPPHVQPKNMFVRCRPSGCIESVFPTLKKKPPHMAAKGNVALLRQREQFMSQTPHHVKREGEKEKKRAEKEARREARRARKEKMRRSEQASAKLEASTASVPGKLGAKREDEAQQVHKREKKIKKEQEEDEDRAKDKKKKKGKHAAADAEEAAKSKKRKRSKDAEGDEKQRKKKRSVAE